MPILKKIGFVVAIFLLINPSIFAQKNIPHLQKKGTATQLIVDEKPFLMLTGELHNSSASSMEYMRPIWQRLKNMHLNSVIANISWELVEPTEGKFDFSSVDGLIAEARANDLKLILLWFGSWKNGQSTYVPAWVKTDINRFPRVKDETGNSTLALSPFGKNALAADTKAFKAFMKHLKKIDGKEHTVVLVQIENEVGVLGATRDFSELANDAFSKSVPTELLTYLQKNKAELLPKVKTIWEKGGAKMAGNWETVFGESPQTDELLMAWQYAIYLNELAEEGKAIYPLPMFVNAWGKQNAQQKPGGYPSGGPVSDLMDIWRAGAPSIDFLSPDIYSPDFKNRCELYSRKGNPLFIPETKRDAGAAERPFYFFGEMNGMGLAPFGIDNEVFTPEHPIVEGYGFINKLLPIIAEYQGTGKMNGFLQETNSSEKYQFEKYKLDLFYQGVKSDKLKGCGMVIQTAEDEFMLIGRGFNAQFTPNSDQENIGILSAEEGYFKNGKWQPLRRLNGDETSSGTMLRFPKKEENKYGIQKVKLYTYPVTRNAGYVAPALTAADHPELEGIWNIQMENPPQGDGKGKVKLVIENDAYKGTVTSMGFEIPFEKIEVTPEGVAATYTMQGFSIVMAMESSDGSKMKGNVSNIYPFTGNKTGDVPTKKTVTTSGNNFAGNWDILIKDTPEADLNGLLTIAGKSGSLTIRGKKTMLKEVKIDGETATIVLPFQGYDATMKLNMKDGKLDGKLADIYEVLGERK